MTTPGDVLRDAVARHAATRAVMAAVAAEIEAERAETSDSGHTQLPPSDATPPPPPAGG